MNNFKQRGYRLAYNNSGSAIAQNAVVTIKSGGGVGGVNLGVAVDAIAATTGTGVLQIGGIFALPKTAGEAYAFGDLLYWTGSALTSTSSGNTFAGQCMAAAGSGDTTADVLLNNQPYDG